MARPPLEPLDDRVLALYDRARAALPAGARWFDAHTHIGQNDPDGVTGTAEELIADLDAAGHDRALVFPMHEPGGYAEANDMVVAEARRSRGRLTALVRVDPKAPGAVEEARRGIANGARGIKLHPRSDAFGLPHPVVDELVGVAAEVRGPVLFHAGRGIPHLGEAATDLARKHPDARLILAHAGISDLGWIAPAAAELPNLFFDTAWWQVWDLLTLFATVPPGQILYASDVPYNRSQFAGLGCLRAALAVGHEGETLGAIVGGQCARVVDGEDPLDLGPAPGPPPHPRRLGDERVVAYLTAAAQQIFRCTDATEALALARLGCQTPDGDDPILVCAAELIDRGCSAREGVDLGDVASRWRGIYPLLSAHLVAGTPGVPV